MTTRATEVASILGFFLDHGSGTVDQLAAACNQNHSQVQAHLAWLDLLGVVKPDRHGSQALADEKHARMIVESLKHFAESGHSVLGDLSRRGDELVWVRVFRELERRRAGFNAPFNAPVRESSVGLAIIVGQHNRDRYVLFERVLDSVGEHFKLVGGKKEWGEFSKETATRELTEEIQRDLTDVLRLAECPEGFSMDTVEASRSTGALTRYHFRLHPVAEYGSKAFTYTGSLRDSLRWLSLNSIQRRLKSSPGTLTLACFPAAVLAHIRETPVVYAMRDSDMERTGD